MLPENLEEAAIELMAVGESGWAVPWAMWVDGARQCWLHPKYTVTERPGGTGVMLVELRADGYHVWPPAGYRWSPQSEPGYVSPHDTQYIPVAKLHAGGEDL